MHISKKITTIILPLFMVLLSCVQQVDGAGRTKKRVARQENTTHEQETNKKIGAQEALKQLKKMAESAPSETPEPKKARSFGKTHEQLINMLRGLLHVPYIVTLDSHNSQTIAITALLSAFATNSRLLYELLREQKNTSLLKNIIWNLPKACGYSAGALYEYGRFAKSDEIAEANKIFDKKLRSLKIQQAIQLILELCLRGLVYKVSLSGTGQEKVLQPVAEIADIVELWRLVSRYNTFFLEPEHPEHAIPEMSGKEFDGQKNQF